VASPNTPRLKFCVLSGYAVHSTVKIRCRSMEKSNSIRPEGAALKKRNTSFKLVDETPPMTFTSLSEFAADASKSLPMGVLMMVCVKARYGVWSLFEFFNERKRH